MVQQFDIIYAKQQIGQVTVTKEGLYYCFQGIAQPPTDKLYRLWVMDGKNKTSLGIMIPEGNFYMLKTKLPINHFISDHFSFELRDNTQSDSTGWIPIYEDHPFLQLSELKNARLQIRDQQPGAIWYIT